MRKSIATALLFATVAWLQGSASASPTWSIADSQNRHETKHNFLNDIACVSQKDCWAIGYFHSGSAYQPLIQHWDGETWLLVESPDTSTTHDEYLQSIACASPTRCWIVGFSWSRPDSQYQPLIMGWDGHSWSVIPHVKGLLPENGNLFDVACNSPSDCWTVGYQQIGLLGGSIGPRRTLIRHWDGTTWMTVESPNTLPTQSNTLVAVTCADPSECWAVGSHAAGSAEQTLTLRWNGGAWAIVPSPNTAITEPNFLNGVNCASPSECWAVGVHKANQDQSLIERWDGSSWSIVPSENTSPDLANVLFSASCSTSEDCWAVGYHKAGTLLQTLLHHWDGEAWTISQSPNSSPGETNTFRASTCTGGDECWAVGNYYDQRGISRSLITRYWDPTKEPVD